jgi:exonuclease III
VQEAEDFHIWCVLDLNVRGLNSEGRQLSVRRKIDESQCSIVCLQETKMEYFDHRIIRGFCPKRFDNFVYSPSVGASGGIIVLWSSAIFSGILVELQRFSIVINFTSTHNSDNWTMVTVYVPCEGLERDEFVQWLYNLVILVDSLWIFLGDFNFIRSIENRNKAGGDMKCLCSMILLVIWVSLSCLSKGDPLLGAICKQILC